MQCRCCGLRVQFFKLLQKRTTLNAVKKATAAGAARHAAEYEAFVAEAGIQAAVLALRDADGRAVVQCDAASRAMAWPDGGLVNAVVERFLLRFYVVVHH